MNLVPEYFRRVSSLPRGRLILLSQIMMMVVAMWLFVRTAPWVTAHDISEIDQYESPTPAQPEWAKAFSVNHGTFHYYGEAPSDSPFKYWGAIAGYFGFGVFWVGWTMWAWKRGGLAVQEQAPLK